jgi:uncharacterized protein
VTRFPKGQAPLTAALAFFFCFLAIAAHAAPSFPKLTGRVVDDANILSAATEQQLDARLADLEAKTTDQMVVVTLPSLQGYDISDYGYQLGRAWRIGQKGKDNGVLLIVAPNEHKVRIEVGYGLEPVLTDALSSVILQEKVLPRFRSGDVEGGVVAGADAVVDQLSLPEDQAKQNVAAAAARPKHEGKPGIGAIIPLLIILFIFFSVFRRGGWWLLPLIFSGSGRRGGWGDGGGWGGGGWSGGGGGGFSGGGGSFGGGGSSGSW